MLQGKRQGVWRILVEGDTASLYAWPWMPSQSVLSQCIHHSKVSVPCTINIWGHINPCHELCEPVPHIMGCWTALLACGHCIPAATCSQRNVNPECSHILTQVPSGTKSPQWLSCLSSLTGEAEVMVRPQHPPWGTDGRQEARGPT